MKMWHDHPTTPPRLSLVVRSRSWLLAGGMALGASLGAPPPAVGQEPEARDSAGIRIVHNREPLHAAGAWTISAEPEVEIGRAEGPPEQLLFNVRAATALSDGTIVVAMNDRSTSEVRYFDSAGVYLTSVAGRGEGPGEFGRVRHVQAIEGDSVLVIVGAGVRYAVFDNRGELGRSGLIQHPNLYPKSGYVGGGRIVASKDFSIATTETGPRMNPELITLVDFREERIDTIDILPGEKWYRDIPYIFQQPFTRMVFGGGGEGRVWLTRSDVPEVRRYTPDGEVDLIVRGLWSRREVTSADRQAWIDSYIGDLAHRRRFLRDHAEFPDFLPVVDNLEVDRLGNVWVLRYESPGTTGPMTWDVLDEEGRWVSVVEVSQELLLFCSRMGHLPRCDPVLEIGEDYVLMLQEDEFGAPLLRRHRLTR